MIINFNNHKSGTASIYSTNSTARAIEPLDSVSEELIEEYNRGYSEGYSAGYDAALREFKGAAAEPEYTTGEYEYIEADECGTYGLSDTYYDIDEREDYEPSLKTKLLQCGIYVALGIAFVIAMKLTYML